MSRCSPGAERIQADGWTRSRRIIAKIEINRHGSNCRFVVSNLTGSPEGVYHGCYVQRSDVPERPIGTPSSSSSAVIVQPLVLLFQWLAVLVGKDCRDSHLFCLLG